MKRILIFLIFSASLDAVKPKKSGTGTSPAPKVGLKGKIQKFGQKKLVKKGRGKARSFARSQGLSKPKGGFKWTQKAREQQFNQKREAAREERQRAVRTQWLKEKIDKASPAVRVEIIKKYPKQALEARPDIVIKQYRGIAHNAVRNGKINPKQLATATINQYLKDLQTIAQGGQPAPWANPKFAIEKSAQVVATGWTRVMSALELVPPKEWPEIKPQLNMLGKALFEAGNSQKIKKNSETHELLRDYDLDFRLWKQYIPYK